jgi:hypothetical protein
MKGSVRCSASYAGFLLILFRQHIAELRGDSPASLFMAYFVPMARAHWPVFEAMKRTEIMCSRSGAHTGHVFVMTHSRPNCAVVSTELP